VREAMKVMRSVTFFVPVVQIEIMKHGTCQQNLQVRVERQAFVYGVAQLRHILAMLIRRDIPVLDKLFHFLDVFVRLYFGEYFVHFLIAVHKTPHTVCAGFSVSL
jgi:hypothetical protein